MCTVIIEVPESRNQNIRFLAVRDENPERPWDPLGSWWPETPDIVGVHDQEAGGAWLAVSDEKQKLAVILNRIEFLPVPTEGLASRGRIVLDAITGKQVPKEPVTQSFNLVEIEAQQATINSYNGEKVIREEIRPGVHMIAHDNMDDFCTPRIKVWLPEFQKLAGLPENKWQQAWLDLLEKTTELGPENNKSIIRDNRVYGIPTLSLMYVIGEVSDTGVTLNSKVFDKPGQL
ncbi:MAG: NRDE family protein [Micrococcaceae bacterium]